MLLLFCFRTEEFYEFVHIKIHWFELHIFDVIVFELWPKLDSKRIIFFQTIDLLLSLPYFPLSGFPSYGTQVICAWFKLCRRKCLLFICLVYLCAFFSLSFSACVIWVWMYFSKWDFFFRLQYLYVQRRITFLCHYWQIKTLLKCQWREEWAHNFLLISHICNMIPHTYRFWISESNDRTNKELWTKELNIHRRVSIMHHPW